MQDIYMNKTGLYADVILPATAWGKTRAYTPVQTADSSGRKLDRAGRGFKA